MATHPFHNSHHGDSGVGHLLSVIAIEILIVTSECKVVAAILEGSHALHDLPFATASFDSSHTVTAFAN